jgi:HipA-like C-terminal domain
LPYIWLAKEYGTMQKGRGGLRKEYSQNSSGKIVNKQRIPLLKENDYIVKNRSLDGDAPKQFVKAYFYEPGGLVKKSSSGSWPSFIAKTAAKWYPHESVTEYMINCIGQQLGLCMNEVKLVYANDQIRFLSRYFLKQNEKLIHGAEICGEHLGDLQMARQIANHKTTSRELFTFEFIKDAVRSVFPACFENLLTELVKMIAFDALAGNNDRHFYNWGIIDTKKKTAKLPTFAPLYDSARGLLWNYSDENIRKIYREGEKKVVDYIKGACPRISIENNTQANHFELIDFVKRYNSGYRTIINELASVDKEQKVLAMLTEQIYPYFIPERSMVITTILKNRFKTIRSI